MVELGPVLKGLDSTPRGRLAASVRSLAAIANMKVDEAAAIEAIDMIEAIKAVLTATAPEPQQAPVRERAPFEHDFFLHSPIAGIYNPLAPPLNIEIVEGSGDGPKEVRSTVHFGRIYQGPPNCVHGGLVAAVLDDSLGVANVAAGVGGMTGTLTVRYHRPTPLDTDLRVEARVVKQDGRKIYSWAGLYDRDTLLAEAEGLFIILRPKS